MNKGQLQFMNGQLQAQVASLQKQLAEHEKGNNLLVFKVLQRDALLIANEIDLPSDEPATFLSECRFSYKGVYIVSCGNPDSPNYHQACSKRCTCPEPKGGDNEAM